MAMGYTVCIDLDRISESIETLTSIENCINKVDLSSYFIEIEKKLTNINLEHNDCLTNYKSSINLAIDLLEEVEKNINDLSNALIRTNNDFSDSANITKSDLDMMSDIYNESTASINLKEALKNNVNIRISNDVSVFNSNIDDSIKDFMVKSNLNDYPSNYNSLEEWNQSLLDKYNTPDFTEEEKQELVSQEMAIWRQQQTGSKISSLATSDYVEHQANISELTNRYMEKYNLSENDANKIATLKEEYNTLKISSPEKLDNLSKQINSLEEKFGINFKKTDLSASMEVISKSPSPTEGINNTTAENTPQVTTIPTPTTEIPQSNSNHTPINTIPIGLGIAATGIAGSIGAVIINEMDSKKSNKIEEYHDEDYDSDLQLEDGTYIDEIADDEEIERYNDKTNIAPPEAYHASRNPDIIDKFYGENDFEEEEE